MRIRLFACGLIAVLVASVLWAKAPIMTPADTPVIGELDAYVIETIYKSKDAEASLESVQEDPRFQALIKKHSLRLFGGPQVGSVTPTSARFWVRTPVAATVQVVIEGGPKSAQKKTGPKGDYAAILDIQGLKAETAYRYNVLVDGKAALAKPATFKTFPEARAKTKFDVAFGGGARYVPEKERMWSTIASFKPAAFLFLGDNIYIDEPDWRGKQRAMYYRRQFHPAYRQMSSTSAIYSIWDDHDFGKNDSAGGPHPTKPAWKVPAWRVFKENWVNPGYGGGEGVFGCWYKFSIGDVDFFMTDGRYYRNFKGGTMLGPVQKKWLLDELGKSKATFKVIASGTLWTETADKGGKDSWWGVPKERDEIFDFIADKNIGGVFLISADRHRTDIYRIKRPKGYDLYEFETSKLTNKHTHGTKKEALFSYNKGNFFGMLRFDLAQSDPVMTFECITIDGKSVHAFPLKRSQLQKAD